MLCNGFDGTKALTVGEAPEPHPAPDEVLIDVHAASVSYMDYLMICGGYQMRPALPYVPGTDAAGVVVACGEKVERFRPGDRVTCENWFGGFAERMTAKASNCTSSGQYRFHCRIDSVAHLPHGLVCTRRARTAKGRRNRSCYRCVRRRWPRLRRARAFARSSGRRGRRGCLSYCISDCTRSTISCSSNLSL